MSDRRYQYFYEEPGRNYYADKRPRPSPTVSDAYYEPTYDQYAGNNAYGDVPDGSVYVLPSGSATSGHAAMQAPAHLNVRILSEPESRSAILPKRCTAVAQYLGGRTGGNLDRRRAGRKRAERVHTVSSTDPSPAHSCAVRPRSIGSGCVDPRCRRKKGSDRGAEKTPSGLVYAVSAEKTALQSRQALHLLRRARHGVYLGRVCPSSDGFCAPHVLSDLTRHSTGMRRRFTSVHKSRTSKSSRRTSSNSKAS